MKNTAEFNRYALMGFFILVIALAVLPLIAGYHLFMINDYHDIQVFLSDNLNHSSLLLRAIISGLNSYNFTVLGFAANVVKALNWTNYIMIGLLIYLVAARKEKSLKVYISYFDLLMAIESVFILLKLVLIITSLYTATTLLKAINGLHLLGLAMIVQYLVLIIASIVVLIKVIKKQTIE